ncbi:hypothetical protein HU200_055542 [Digitaria exilis]|uniref:Uncharacterized protein n=1 Tax=Digitaria exilis TaxID=1010633 RepID=A0A835E6F1_9POAL|nr:hypothetical protein HU200_055542 [Digitaria exilis]
MAWASQLPPGYSIEIVRSSVTVGFIAHRNNSSAPIPLEVDDHPRAGMSVTGTFTLERVFPSRSRFGKPRAGQARACHAGNDAQGSQGITAPCHRPRSGEDTGQIHSQQWTSERHAARPDLTLAAALHATILEGDPRRKLRRLDLDAVRKSPPLDAVSRHEKEVRYVNHCHVVSRSWKARFPLAQGREAHAKKNLQRQADEQHEDDHNDWGLRSSSPSPTLLVTPYYEQRVIRCTAPLLDVRPRGRNQDKIPISPPAIRATNQTAEDRACGVHTRAVQQCACATAGLAAWASKLATDARGGRMDPAYLQPDAARESLLWPTVLSPPTHTRHRLAASTPSPARRRTGNAAACNQPITAIRCTVTYGLFGWLLVTPAGEQGQSALSSLLPALLPAFLSHLVWLTHPRPLHQPATIALQCSAGATYALTRPRRPFDLMPDLLHAPSPDGMDFPQSSASMQTQACLLLHSPDLDFVTSVAGHGMGGLIGWVNESILDERYNQAGVSLALLMQPCPISCMHRSLDGTDFPQSLETCRARTPCRLQSFFGLVVVAQETLTEDGSDTNLPRLRRFQQQRLHCQRPKRPSLNNPLAFPFRAKEDPKATSTSVMASGSTSTDLTMKLFINARAQQVLFAEVSHEALDFLYALLPDDATWRGCIDNLADTFDELSYLDGRTPEQPLLLHEQQPRQVRRFFLCGTRRGAGCKGYVAAKSGVRCPSCGGRMDAEAPPGAPGAGCSGDAPAAAPAAAGAMTLMDELSMGPTLGNALLALGPLALEEATVRLGRKEIFGVNPYANRLCSGHSPRVARAACTRAPCNSACASAHMKPHRVPAAVHTRTYTHLYTRGSTSTRRRQWQEAALLGGDPPPPALSMRLVVDADAERVAFAEAGKDVADFLFSLLALPLARASKLAADAGAVDCLRRSTASMDPAYLQPGAARDALLWPTVLSPPAHTQILSERGSSTPAAASTAPPGAMCPSCGGEMKVVAQPGRSGGGTQQATTAGGEGAGFVRGGATYVVMDDLTVAPMPVSVVSSVDLLAGALGTLSVGRVGALQEKNVVFGSDKSKTVLTDVFLRRMQV